jgi:hypothetical protein
LPEYGDCFHLVLTEFERLNNLIYWNNIELSQRCADAVASNDQESGRAKNRRVALVKQ